VFLVGWSPVAVAVALALYGLRMFAITGFYHRYFSHRSYRTSRLAQFLFAVAGNSSAQRGPLWWAGHHRFHHRHADRDGDLHSPRLDGFLHSHVGWLLTDGSRRTRFELVSDLARYPELRFLDRFYWIVPALLALSLHGLGAWLAAVRPAWGTDGWQMLVWGFFVSTFLLLQGTYTVNSLAHRFGTRRYEVRDDSRNNLWIALLTLGEGWHNNHHRFPSAARQGHRWWEIDVTWYGLLLLERLRIIRDLRPVPRTGEAS
jgi:stearoyl-CoA desaturase (delta-9 desaturase)